MNEPTEAPTPRRLARARREGDSGVSGVAARAVGFLAALALGPAAITAAGDWFAGDLRAAIARIATLDGDTRAPDLLPDAGSLARAVLGLGLPMVGAAAVTGLAAVVVQTGGVVAFARLGARRRSLRDGFVPLVAAVAAGLAVGTSVVHRLGQQAADLARLVERPEAVAHATMTLAGEIALDAALVGIAVGLADLLLARLAWRRRVRMTRRDVVRERRETEGHPAIEAARERAFREGLDAAALASVRDAAVVVTGDARSAVALRWHEGRDPAPVVIASGEGVLGDLVARAGDDAGVPRREHRELAVALRALHVGWPVPPALYDGVAELLGDTLPSDDASSR